MSTSYRVTWCFFNRFLGLLEKKESQIQDGGVIFFFSSFFLQTPEFVLNLNHSPSGELSLVVFLGGKVLNFFLEFSLKSQNQNQCDFMKSHQHASLWIAVSNF